MHNFCVIEITFATFNLQSSSRCFCNLNNNNKDENVPPLEP